MGALSARIARHRFRCVRRSRSWPDRSSTVRTSVCGLRRRQGRNRRAASCRARAGRRGRRSGCRSPNPAPAGQRAGIAGIGALPLGDAPDPRIARLGQVQRRDRRFGQFVQDQGRELRPPAGLARALHARQHRLAQQRRDLDDATFVRQGGGLSPGRRTVCASRPKSRSGSHDRSRPASTPPAAAALPRRRAACSPSSRLRARRSAGASRAGAARSDAPCGNRGHTR